MAAISQENVTQLGGYVNNANGDFNAKVTNGVTTFANNVKEVWESERARSFASALNEAITNIATAYKTNIAGIVEALNTNVRNHNQFNQGNVVVPSISEVSFNTSALQEIQAKFADGFEGLRDGRTASEVVEYFEQMKASIQEVFTSAASSIQSANAFDNASEQEAVAQAFRRIYESFNSEMDALKTELVSALAEVDESAQSLTNTNINNVNVG